METIHMLEAELEELQKRYWHCFNNWHCDDDMAKIECQIDALKYKLSLEMTNIPKLPENSLAIAG